MQFVNPYNFISLPKDRVQKLSLEDEKYTKGEKLTGKLVCRLVTRTPLIIPDHEKKIKGKMEGEKKVTPDRYPFMTVEIGGEEKPMIPGSSIRGVVRSVFETLTDSCVRTNDDYYFSSRTGLAKEEGLLQNTEDGWKLYAATRYADSKKLITQRAKTGDEVQFTGIPKGNSYYVTDANGLQTGYILKMNPFPGKKPDGTRYVSAWSVMEKKEGVPAVTIDPIWITVFEKNIEKYVAAEEESNRTKEKSGKQKTYFAREYADWYEKAKRSGEIIPVWYEKVEERYYFALSQLSRNVYANKPKDFLEKKNLQPCENRSALCDACALFGFVGDGSETGAMGSKVRFSDAWSKSMDVLGDYLPPMLLASPRSSSLEFYLRSEEKAYNADDDGVALAGRKFYWHHIPNEHRRDNNPNMSTIMQYAKENRTFTFKVYFDGITQTQLQQLFTALTLGENREDSELCHKLGHAKPLGFGSAKVVVEKTVLRSYQEGKYEEKTIPAPASLSLPPELQKMLRFAAAAGQRVDYPRRQPGGPIYEWFSANRPPQNRPAKLEYFCKLPFVIDPKDPDRSIALPENPKDRTARALVPPQDQAPQPSAADDQQQRICVVCGKPCWVSPKYTGTAPTHQACRNKKK